MDLTLLTFSTVYNSDEVSQCPLSEPFWLRRAKLSIRFDFQTFQSNVTMIQTAPILELARILILDLKARTNPAKVTTHKLVFFVRNHVVLST